MPKPLKLAKDGRLAVPESDVEQAITDFLEIEGWLVIPTKAEARMPSGKAAHKKWTLDAVAMRVSDETYDVWPDRDICAPSKRAYSHVIHLEFKRRDAATDKKRLAGQTATAKQLLKFGFLVYQAPEKHKGEMFAHFLEFYRLEGF